MAEKEARYIPLQTEKQFVSFLESLSPQQSITSEQNAEAWYFILEHLSHGKTTNLDALAQVQKHYPQALLNGRPKDPETLSTVLSYVGERLPTKVMRKNAEVFLSNTSSSTMAVPHLYDEGDNGHIYRKKSPARSRWSVIDVTDHDRPKITFDLRDTDPMEPTDGFEVLSWLGSLEQVRQTTLELIEEGVDISPIKKAMSKVLRKHVEAEIEMLNKRLLLPMSKEISQRCMSRIVELERRLSQNESLAKELFEEWLGRDGREVTISTAVSEQGEILLDIDTDRTEEKRNAARETVRLVKEGLEREGIETVTDVFYGNDFTLRLFLSLGLFADDEWEILETYLADKLKKVEPTIQDLSDSDMQVATRKFFLVQQLSLYTGNILVLQNLKQRLFNEHTFKQIGITRIVQTKESPTADPVDVICPEKIDPLVLERLPKVIRELMEKIRENKQIIVSIAYPLGHLTAMLSEAFHDAFPLLEGFSFAGKVGMYSLGADEDKVGHLMFPQRVLNQFGDESIPVINSLAETEVEAYGHGVRKGVNFTTAALTMQEHREMKDQAEELHGGEVLSLDVELFHLMRWYSLLPEKERAEIALYLGYYFSDKSIDPGYFDPEKHSGDKISESLGLRGSVPVFLSFYILLEHLAEKKR